MKRALALSRIWYLAAIAITACVIALASWLISVTHAPAGQFLFGVAQCSTSWSHGQCTW